MIGNLDLHEIIDLCDGGGGMTEAEAQRFKSIVLGSEWGDTKTSDIPNGEWGRMLDEATIEE